MERSPSLPAQPMTVRGGCPLKKVRDADFIWKDEARKVSHELSQICEEAFNGSSMSTTRTTSTCDDTDTPATSVSMASPENSHPLLTGNKLKTNSAESSPEYATFSTAELAETRRKLLEHSAKEGCDKVPAYLTGVINHLDRLIEQDRTRQNSRSDEPCEQIINLSDPFAKPTNDAGYLPVITEELLSPTEIPRNSMAQEEQRVASQSSANTNGTRASGEGKTTVRIVPHSSLGSIEEPKPLNIRKKSQMEHSPELAHLDLEEQKTKQDSTGKRDSLFTRWVSGGSRQGRQPCELDPIDEDPRAPSGERSRSPEKKWSWFSKHRSQGTEPGSPQAVEHVRPIQPSSETVIIHDVKGTKRPKQNRKTSSERFRESFFKRFMTRRPSEKSDRAQHKPTGKSTQNVH